MIFHIGEYSTAILGAVMRPDLPARRCSVRQYWRRSDSAMTARWRTSGDGKLAEKNHTSTTGCLHVFTVSPYPRLKPTWSRADIQGSRCSRSWCWRWSSCRDIWDEVEWRQSTWARRTSLVHIFSMFCSSNRWKTRTKHWPPGQQQSGCARTRLRFDTIFDCWYSASV